MDDFSTTGVQFPIAINTTNGDIISSSQPICLTNNSQLHGNLTFSIELMSESFYLLGEVSMATIVILDNEEGIFSIIDI